MVKCLYHKQPRSQSHMSQLSPTLPPLSRMCRRWMGVTILTVREASWLTDNTYKYEEVVRMMGELVAVLVIKGGIRVSR